MHEAGSSRCGACVWKAGYRTRRTTEKRRRRRRREAPADSVFTTTSSSSSPWGGGPSGESRLVRLVPIVSTAALAGPSTSTAQSAARNGLPKKPTSKRNVGGG